jgi:hypothetical protein
VGYRYRDRDASSSGVHVLIARGGPPGTGRLVAKARNNDAKNQSAMPLDIAAALAGAESARAQLVSSDATCFESVLTDVRLADGSVFRAKSP